MRGGQRRSVSMGGMGGLKASGADVRGVLGGAFSGIGKGNGHGNGLGGGGGGGVGGVGLVGRSNVTWVAQ